MYLKKTKVQFQKDACTPSFIAALFTTANIWKQSKCPSTDEWIKKLDIFMYHILYCTNTIYMFNGMLLRNKNRCIFPFTATWTGLEGIILSEISQRKTNTVILYIITYM